MKTKLSAIIMALLVSLVFLVACGKQDEAKEPEPKVTAQDTIKESKEALNTAAEYTEQKKEAYLKQIEDELKTYDQKLDKLKAGAMGLKDDAKAEYEQQIALLEQKKTSASEALDKLKSASGETWNDMKSGMDKAVNEMRNIFDKVIAHFKIP